MRYASLRRMDISNGEGIRVSLFVSGCQLHCSGCFNPDAWDYQYGKPYTKETENEILDLIVRNPHIEGLSILGGDPLWQESDDMRELKRLVDKVHDKGKTVWIWSGFTWESVMIIEPDDKLETARQELIKSCDVFVDGPFIEEKKDLRLKWRGSSNQRVIDVQKSLEAGQIVLYKEKNTI